MNKKIKRKIYDIAKNNLFFRKFIRGGLRFYRKIKYLKYYLFYKVDDNLILFEVFNGRNYSDSPKALYLEMLNDKKYKNYKFVWSFKDIEKHNQAFINHNRTILVKTNSKEYFGFLSKAKYIVVNSIVNESFKKKKEQVCIQCWHGTPLKRLRCDIEVDGSVLNTKKEIVKRNNRDIKNFDYFLSPSKFATEKFISAFNLKNTNKEDIIIEKGYPRNDFLFKHTIKDIERIKKELNIPKDKKVIMYAPTFRDDEHTSGLGYTYKLGIDFDKLKKELEKDYVILFRAHYFVANSFDFDKYKGFIYNVSNIDDVNNIYIISDILITDYSSVFFDYANLKKPMLFYMYDLDNYKNNLRGFYFDLSELPGPIIKKEEDLINEIKNIDKYWDIYKEKYNKFNNKFNYLDDKNASKRVLEAVFNEETK